MTSFALEKWVIDCLNYSYHMNMFVTLPESASPIWRRNRVQNKVNGDGTKAMPGQWQDITCKQMVN